MEYNEELAKKLLEQHNLSTNTLRTWRHRAEIPNDYQEDTEKVLLTAVLSENTLNPRIEKYGEALKRLLSTRLFKAGQEENYYMSCLYSLCSECE